MGNAKIWIALGIYILLVLLDLGLNVVALFIPSLGALAESVTELVIEIGSGLIVVYLAFVKG